MSLFVALCLLVLVSLAVRRWLKGGWLPIHSDHVPLDFASLTINRIPIEVLYGPDAERHPYPLSEPLGFLFQEPIAPPSLFADSSWDASTAMLRTQWRINAGLTDRISPFTTLNGC